MKFKIKSIFNSLILFIVLVIIIYIYISNANILNTINTNVIISFVFVGIITIINILTDKRKFSLNKTFWYFNLFFLFLAPLLQYISNYHMWGYNISNELYIKTNFWIIVWMLIYSFVNKVLKIEIKSKHEKKKIIINKRTLNMFFIISIVALVLGIALIGFSSLFVRNENNVDLGADNISTIVVSFIRTIPVYATLYAIYYYQKNKRGILYLIILFIITFILNYPVSVTRYWVGAVYIGLMIVMLRNKIKNKTFDIGMIGVFAIAFPMFQLFKWYNLTDLINGNVEIKNLMNVYNNADFDAYTMFSRAFLYVEDNSITYGKQLFSSIFFFIPRSIWSTKSIPSGQLIAEAQGQWFTNLSCPLIAEGYINFGYLGIVIYAFLIGIGIKYLDNLYWNKEKDTVTVIDFVYPFCIGLLIFLLRGAFHPVIVYTFSFFLFIIVWRMCSKIIRLLKLK